MAEIHFVLPVAAWLPNLEILDLQGTKSDLGKRPTEVVLWYRRLRPFYRWENRETVSVASLQGKKKKTSTLYCAPLPELQMEAPVVAL